MRLTAEQQDRALTLRDVAEYARKLAFGKCGWLRKMQREDIEQESELALCQAIPKCDFTHPHWKQWLLVTITRHLMRMPSDQAFFVRIPHSVFANRKKYPALWKQSASIEHMEQRKLQPKHWQHTPDPCEGVIIQELRKAIAKLPPKDAEIIRRRYGLDGCSGDRGELQTLANERSVTQQAVSARHLKLVREMRTTLEGKEGP